MQRGLTKALAEARERAVDMEAALAVKMTKGYKYADLLVFDKLRKWQGKTSLQWDWLLKPPTKETP